MSTETDGDGGAVADPKTVPYARFAEVVAERNRLTTERDQSAGALTEAQARIAELEAGAAHGAELQAQLSRHQVDLRLADMGLASDEARTVARALHGRLQGEDAPSLDDWFAQTGKAHPALAAYLTPSAPPVDTPPAPPPSSEVPPADPPKAPNANRDTRPPPGDRPTTFEDLDRAREALRKNPKSEAARKHLAEVLERLQNRSG